MPTPDLPGNLWGMTEASTIDQIRTRAKEQTSGFLDDPRRVGGLIAIAAGLGLIIGFKLAGGMPKEVAVPANPFEQVRVVRSDQPCAGCREKEIRRQQDAAQAAAQRVAEAATARDVTITDQVLPSDPDHPPVTEQSTFDHSAPAQGRAFSPLVSPAVTTPPVQ